MEVKDIDFNLPVTYDKETKTFSGIKHTYKILDSLPVCRFKEIGIVEAELSFGCDLKTIVGFATSVFNNINKGDNRADDAINAYKLIEAANSIRDRTPAILKFIDLYTIAEGQELEHFGGEYLTKKIEDWKHLDANFFFALCTQLIPNYLSVYKQLSLSISQE